MESSSNKRILILVGFTLFFVIIVLVWYFFYAKPVIDPTNNTTRDVKKVKDLPPGFQFIEKIWKGDQTTTTKTEIIDPLSKPLIHVWDRGATGMYFTSIPILQEINATTTEGTTTITVKKTIHATSSVLMFVDTLTGYVYGYVLDTGKIFQITNTSLPGISDAYIWNSGRKIILRYIDQEKNNIVGVIATIGTINQNTEPLPLQNIKYLNSEVTSVAVNKTKTEASYMVSTEKGSSVYTTDGDTSRFVVSSPFKEWDLSYGGNTLYVTPKPSAYVEGSTFSLPYFTSEINNKTGLLSNPGVFGVLLSSMWTDDGLRTFFSSHGNISVLPIKTLATKCVWGRTSFVVCAVPRELPGYTEGLPDDWYQGRYSFSDDLFIVNQNNNEKYMLYSFSQEDGDFDISSIETNIDNTLYSFINQTDQNLWLLNSNLLGD